MNLVRSRRNLPHIYVPGATYFLTFRLATAQANVLSEGERDQVADHVESMRPGKCSAYVIMPDHVHLLYTSTAEEDLRRTLQALKGSSAHRLTASSGRRAPIWQAETFDHLIRNEAEAEETWAYIEMNPVRKGLCLKPESYRWSSAHKRRGTGA